MPRWVGDALLPVLERPVEDLGGVYPVITGEPVVAGETPLDVGSALRDSMTVGAVCDVP